MRQDNLQPLRATLSHVPRHLGVRMGMIYGALVALMLVMMPVPAPAAGNSLEGLSYTSLPGNRLQVKLSLSGPAPEPRSFTIDEPARIALDFPDTSSNLAKRTQAIGIGAARSVSAVEAQGRTRVVVNLVRLVPYEVRIDGNDVLLTMDAGSAPGAVATPAPAAATAATTAVVGRGIQNVDFRRGEQGEGRVIVTLSDPNVPVDVRQEGDTIVVDFLDSSLPERLQRRLDVVDFATPVKMVDTFAQGGNVRMVIQPLTAEYEHLAYQSENVLTIDLKPIPEEEEEKRRKEQFGYVGEKLSLNFQDIEVRAVLQLLADFAGFNLVTSDTVTGNVTLRLKNVPWDQALDIILKTKGLDKRQTGTVMLVAPTEEIAAREKLELESTRQLEELKPLRSEIIQINYARAADLAALLEETRRQGSGGQTGPREGISLLSDRGSVIADERTNSILVQDTGEKIAEIRELVADLDVPVRQVMVESRIVVASTDFARDLGVKFGYSDNADLNGDNTAKIGGKRPGDTRFEGVRFNPVTGELEETDIITGFEVPGDSGLEGLLVNLPAAQPAGALGLVLGTVGSHLLQLELSALQAEGRGEVISNPRVITANGQEALIEQGTEIPYLEASSSGAATVSFKKAVLSLKVTPQITPDDNIIMDLVVTQDNVGETVLLLGSEVPSIDTQEVTTRVLVENGETLVLGGIYQQVTFDNVTKVPFFGDLPVIGWAFRNTSKEDDKTELLVFVTPKISSENLKVGQRLGLP